MDSFSIENNIIPVGEFKAGLSQWIRRVQKSKHPLVITHNGKPAGVLISPAEYDALVQRRRLIDSVSRGIDDADEDRVLLRSEVEEKLSERRAARG